MNVRLVFLSALFLSCVMVNISNDLLEVRSEDHSLENGSMLSFENSNGDLKLVEWENSYVRVEASIYGDSSRGVPDDLSIAIREENGGLYCRVEYPGGLSFCSVDLAVFVPRNSGMSVMNSSVNGETEINAAVDVTVESVNGDVVIDALSSRGITTTNGDISAVLHVQNESLSVETVNGDICLQIPEALGISAETVNGDVNLPGGAVDQVRGTSENTVTVETVNGDINVTRLN